VALEAEFRLQVRTAYTKHLSDKLAAFKATVPHAALPSLPTTGTKITPLKPDKPATETSGNNQGKRKASDAPPCPQQNSTNPIAFFANATIAVTASAAAAIAAATTAATTTTVTTTAATTTAAPGTSVENALEVHDSDSDGTDDTFLPRTFPKKKHGLKIILAMNINNHLKLIKSDISIVAVKPEPGTSNTNYVNGIHFLATVLPITEAPVADLLPHLTNIGNRKDVRTIDTIGFLKTNGVKLARLPKNYKKIMRMDHASPIIIEYSVTRHMFESKELPTSWLQFCILFQKEILLAPFNQKSETIILGNQWTNQKWTKDFNHYCLHNLNYRIAPLDRAVEKGSKGPKIIVRGLQFNNTWAITMPAPDPKP
jgi:hypothetical protein